MNTSKLTQNLLLAGLFFTIASCGKGSGGDDNGGGGSNLPAASISDVTQERSTTGSTYTFNVALSKAASAEVSLNYTTVAATAVENTDFTPTSGTLKIPPIPPARPSRYR